MAHECPRVFLNGAVLPWQPFSWPSLVDPQAQALVDCPSLQTLDLSQNLLTMDCGVSPGFPGTMAKENGKNRGTNLSCVWRLIKWFQSNLDELTRGWNANSMCFVAILWGVTHGMWSKFSVLAHAVPALFRTPARTFVSWSPQRTLDILDHWSCGIVYWEIGEPDLILPVAVEIQYIGDSHGVEGKMGVSEATEMGRVQQSGLFAFSNNVKSTSHEMAVYIYIYIYCNYIILHTYIEVSGQSKPPCCLMIVGLVGGYTIQCIGDDHPLWESHSQPNSNPLLVGRVFPSSPSLRTFSPFDVFGAQKIAATFISYHTWDIQALSIFGIGHVL